MRKLFVIGFGLAAVLSACGGAGAGGAAPQTVQTAAPATTANAAPPAVAGTEAPKQYDTGKTPSPSAPNYYGN